MTRRLSILASSALAIASLAAAPFLLGCNLFGRDPSLVSFMVIDTLDETRVEGNPLGGLVGALLPLSFDVEVDLEAETSARGTGVAQHVYLSDFVLRITATAEGGLDSDDFGFLDSIDVYIEPRSSSSSLPRQLVASLHDVPAESTISLEVEGVDLIEYFREGARLSTEATGSQPTDDVTFDGVVTAIVEVL